MPRITRDSLMTLEAYAKARGEFRTRVMAHKKSRSVRIGPNITLIFEDELTMRYQVQEMLRAEKIFEEQAIQDELDAYNPLVPDGGNWKATMMIEYPQEDERRQMLARLLGIEDKVWVQVQEFARVYAHADEDLERTNAEKTSAVHFLRFDLGAHMIRELRAGANAVIGIDHPQYRYDAVALDPGVRASLIADLA